MRTDAGQVPASLPGIPYGEQEVDGHVLVNDLEKPVFEKHLFLAEMKRWLLAQAGASAER